MVWIRFLWFLILPISLLSGSCEDKGVDMEMQGRDEQGWKAYQLLFKILLFQFTSLKIKKNLEGTESKILP